MRNYADQIEAMRAAAKWIIATATESSFAHDELRALHHADAVLDAVNTFEDMQSTITAQKTLIGELRAEIKQLLDASPQWVSVKDDLPKKSGYTIVFCTDGHINHRTFAKYQKHLKRWDLTGARSYWRVTHWMPMPKSPKRSEA